MRWSPPSTTACTAREVPRPSIDTAMHGLVDSAHVDHLHPDSGIAVATAVDGEELTAKIFGDKVVWVPWRRPGFQLGLDIAKIKADNPQAIGCILGGHGITAWGDTSEECEANSLEIIRTAEAYIAEHSKPEPFGALLDGYAALPDDERRAKAAALAPTLRSIASFDKPMVGHFTDDERVLEFLSGSEHPRLAELGTSCPDHFLRTKVKPLVLDLPADAPVEDCIARLRELHEAYRADYQAYYERHATPDSPPIRGADPLIILVPGVGMFSYGKDKQTARVAGEFYLNAINVMRGAEGLSTYPPIDESEKFKIEYWALEEAKLQRMPKPKPLATRIALVTGAAGGIGKAIAVRLAAEGACVVIADLDAGKAQAAAEEIGNSDVAVGIAADVTDEAAVQAAVDATLLAFGGIDIVINNAGLSLSKSLLDTTVADWDLQHNVMAKGSFLVSRAAAKALIEQKLGRRHRLHLQQELALRRPEQHRLLRHQGRPGASGAVAGSGARRAWREGERHQPRRGGPRLRHLRRGLGRQAGRGLRGARGGVGQVLRLTHAAEAGGASGERRQRGLRALLGRSESHHGPAHSG